MRVVEIVRGLGLGGLEVSLSRRLQFTPADTWTAVLSTQPELNVLSQQVSERADLLVEVEVGKWGAKTLTEQIRSLNPDLIVSHVPRETIKILSSSLPKSIPVVVVAHHPESSERTWAKAPITTALTLVNPRAALHIAVSSAAASGDQCRGAKRIEVLPLGAQLDDAEPDPSAWPEDCRVRLLSLGRLRAFKNLENLLNGVAIASPIMRAQKAFLAIVGEGPERERLARIIEQEGLTDSVGILPATPHPSGILRAADVMVVTSTSEGGPITALEALLAGCRLVSTPTGLFSDLASQHEQVTAIHNSDPTSIAHALEVVAIAGSISSSERAKNAASAKRWDIEPATSRFYDLLRTALHP